MRWPIFRNWVREDTVRFIWFMVKKMIVWGYLVGEAHQGLKYMFQMMNGARIDVGMSATSTATAAYYASLQYANERPQGRKILNSGKKDVTEGQDADHQSPGCAKNAITSESHQ
jgi:hypothetical protein